MDDQIRVVMEEMLRYGRFQQESTCFQHGRTTVLDHSVHVAQTSLAFAKVCHLPVHETFLIRGALLHDYFLYDWHDKASAPSFHGICHPRIALNNAHQDFELNKIEENIILRHMFPLTPIPPLYLEAWVVCFADKCCALQETLFPRLCFALGGME